jgi:hypothetical protein
MFHGAHGRLTNSSINHSTPAIPIPYSLPFSHRLLRVFFFLFNAVTAEEVGETLREG